MKGPFPNASTMEDCCREKKRELRAIIRKLFVIFDDEKNSNKLAEPKVAHVSLGSKPPAVAKRIVHTEQDHNELDHNKPDNSSECSQKKQSSK